MIFNILEKMKKVVVLRVDTSIKKKKNQSHNFIIDVSKSKLSNDELINQIEKIYINRKWINKVIVKRNEKVLFIYIKRD